MRLLTKLVAPAALALSLLGGAAQAMPDANAVNDLSKAQSPVTATQFVWGGQNYCWYAGGWRGPGWYWCGYAWRSGFGWGGPYGWHGWGYGHPGWRWGHPGWGGHPGWRHWR
jgi:hypothetical protein